MKVNLNTNQRRYKAIEMLCNVVGISNEQLTDYIVEGKLPKTEKPKVEAKLPKTEKPKA